MAEVGGRNRAEALEAPFVGRDDELRLLKDLFHATAREKRVRLVSVIGPAGIGKSRLAWEFLKYIDGLVEDVWWHSGRSPSYGEGITFWALGEMVRGALRAAGDRRRARPRAHRWRRPSPSTSRTPRSGAGSSRRCWRCWASEVGVAARMQLFAAWRTFFERMAATDRW